MRFGTVGFGTVRHDRLDLSLTIPEISQGLFQLYHLLFCENMIQFYYCGAWLGRVGYDWCKAR